MMERLRDLQTRWKIRSRPLLQVFEKLCYPVLQHPVVTCCLGGFFDRKKPGRIVPRGIYASNSSVYVAQPVSASLFEIVLRKDSKVNTGPTVIQDRIRIRISIHEPSGTSPSFKADLQRELLAQRQFPKFYRLNSGGRFVDYLGEFLLPKADNTSQDCDRVT
jgi:hypothetical protein